MATVLTMAGDAARPTRRWLQRSGATSRSSLPTRLMPMLAASVAGFGVAGALTSVYALPADGPALAAELQDFRAPLRAAALQPGRIGAHELIQAGAALSPGLARNSWSLWPLDATLRVKTASRLACNADRTDSKKGLYRVVEA